MSTQRFPSLTRPRCFRPPSHYDREAATALAAVPRQVEQAVPLRTDQQPRHDELSRPCEPLATVCSPWQRCFASYWLINSRIDRESQGCSIPTHLQQGAPLHENTTEQLHCSALGHASARRARLPLLSDRRTPCSEGRTRLRNLMTRECLASRSFRLLGLFGQARSRGRADDTSLPYQVSLCGTTEVDRVIDFQQTAGWHIDRLWLTFWQMCFHANVALSSCRRRSASHAARSASARACALAQTQRPSRNSRALSDARNRKHALSNAQHLAASHSAVSSTTEHRSRLHSVEDDQCDQRVGFWHQATALTEEQCSLWQQVEPRQHLSRGLRRAVPAEQSAPGRCGLQPSAAGDQPRPLERSPFDGPPPCSQSPARPPQTLSPEPLASSEAVLILRRKALCATRQISCLRCSRVAACWRTTS